MEIVEREENYLDDCDLLQDVILDEGETPVSIIDQIQADTGCTLDEARRAYLLSIYDVPDIQ